MKKILLKMKPYEKEVQFLLIFVILENFIVSYISNCMVVMYQSTFFFFYWYSRTHTQ